MNCIYLFILFNCTTFEFSILIGQTVLIVVSQCSAAEMQEQIIHDMVGVVSYTCYVECNYKTDK